jgi:hypothetical protein
MVYFSHALAISSALHLSAFLLTVFCLSCCICKVDLLQLFCLCIVSVSLIFLYSIPLLSRYYHCTCVVDALYVASQLLGLQLKCIFVPICTLWITCCPASCKFHIGQFAIPTINKGLIGPYLLCLCTLLAEITAFFWGTMVQI